ncbi:MAG TPA: peptidoglycan editing factor PgeF [Terriglobia bacterium]|nr:peptidoglycan editing factor PgeF [Terriglobia bacterium]
MKWLACAALSLERWAVHAFSTRLGARGGGLARGLNLGFTPGESRARVERNRTAFFRAMGARGFDLAEIRQVHSTLIYRVRRGERGVIEYLPSGYPPGEGQGPPQGDALMTDEPGILLAVRTADCVPVLLLDSRRRAVAAIHAGWKGMLGGIVEKTAGEMRRQFGSRPGDLFAAVGPSIGVCCYEVGEEVAEHFRGGFAGGENFVVSGEIEDAGGPAQKRAPYPPPFLSKTPPGHGPDPAPRPHLDLVATARYQLLRAGVLSSHIAVAGFCTASRTDLFFSYRKEGSHTGRMMSVIGIRRSGKR